MTRRAAVTPSCPSPRPASVSVRGHGALLPALLAAWLWAAATPSVGAQDFFSLGEFIVNELTPYTQEYGRCDVDFDGDRIGFAWETVLGHEVRARLFDGDGLPVMDSVQVNTQTQYIQDEPDIALDSQGNFLVAWSDRFGYDGSMMGIFARLYDAAGAPITPEFQVNVEWNQSQWEPLVYATPDDDWVVAWSGRSNGDAFFRVFDGDGTPLTGDVQVNTFVNNAQIDTALAIAPDGTIFATYVDFGANGFGGGQNIFGRRFTTSGVPLDSTEFQIHENFVAGDQREPRVVVDRRNRFLVAWEDSAADGSGYAIVARRFGSDGLALGPEFIVNTTTAGHQRDVALAVDWVGNFIVAWADGSTVPGRLVAQRFDQHGAMLGGEIEVRTSMLGDIKLPDVAVDEAGEEFVFAFTARYEGPPGPSTPQTEIYAKRYRFEPIHLPAPATVGTTFDMDLHFPGGAGYYYFLLGAFSTSPGIPLPDGRVVPLAEDVLFNFSLAFPHGGVLNGFQGWLDAAGQATAMVTLPNDPGIVGVTLHFATVTVDVTQFDLINQLRHVTDPKAVVLE